MPPSTAGRPGAAGTPARSRRRSCCRRPAAPRTGRGSRRSLAVRDSPSAVTMSTESRLSHVSPCLPTSQPTPPPSVSPAMPVVDDRAAGGRSPNACVSRSNSPQVTPGSARAVRRTGSTCTERIADMSSTTPPSQSALPATLCPPPRTAIGAPESRAKRTPSTTSLTPAQRTITPGRLSTIPFHTRRAAS